jgi:SSS family transporter
MESTWLEYLVIAGYLVLLVTISFLFRKLSTNQSDYFRSGCRSKWWLAGSSCFMTCFSAWTFTGAAGAAFEAGWSALIIFLTNVVAFLINAAFLAPWFRQLRVISPPEVIRNRFGERTRQFYAWITVFTQLCFAALHLYGLAIFSSAVFGYNVQTVILVLGSAVLLYSMVGGIWGIMASDFVQGSILMPMTILLAILCLIKVGGVGGLLDKITESGLSGDYAMFNDGTKFNAKYTYFWAFVVLVKSVTAFNSLTNAQRFFSVKTGKEGRKAALLTAVLMFLGSMIWFIPPMTARLFYADAVNSVDIAKPAEAAYAIAGVELLPAGLTGLMVVAMFAATTSSMDSGLNRNSAIFTNDMYPAICRFFGIQPSQDGRKLLLIGRIFTVFFGLVVISMAYYLSIKDAKGIFQYMLDISGMLMVPLLTPFLLGLLLKKVPYWSCMFSVIVGFTVSAIGYLSGSEISLIQSIPFLREPWLWQTKTAANFVATGGAFCITTIFWKAASEDYRKQVKEFFTRMKTPVDFEKEIGEANDSLQSKMIGWICIVIGSAICLLILLPNPWSLFGRYGILFVGGLTALIGLLLVLTTKRSSKELLK